MRSFRQWAAILALVFTLPVSGSGAAGAIAAQAPAAAADVRTWYFYTV
jgi:hypothetical protein